MFILCFLLSLLLGLSSVVFPYADIMEIVLLILYGIYYIEKDYNEPYNHNNETHKSNHVIFPVSN